MLEATQAAAPADAAPALAALRISRLSPSPTALYGSKMMLVIMLPHESLVTCKEFADLPKFCY